MCATADVDSEVVGFGVVEALLHRAAAQNERNTAAQAALVHALAGLVVVDRVEELVDLQIKTKRGGTSLLSWPVRLLIPRLCHRCHGNGDGR